MLFLLYSYGKFNRSNDMEYRNFIQKSFSLLSVNKSVSPEFLSKLIFTKLDKASKKYQYIYVL